MGFMKEFREFAMKGNVVDLAVGVIIGAAFGKIVTSMIDDMIMPIVGLATKGKDFSNKYFPLTDTVRDAIAKDPNLGLADARKIGPVLAYGNFATIVINFLILAFVIFLMIKAMNNAKRKFERQQEVAPAAAPSTPSAQEVYLREIRDLLARR